jgi:hypothetical protein
MLATLPAVGVPGNCRVNPAAAFGCCVIAHCHTQSQATLSSRVSCVTASSVNIVKFLIVSFILIVSSEERK